MRFPSHCRAAPPARQCALVPRAALLAALLPAVLLLAALAAGPALGAETVWHSLKAPGVVLRYTEPDRVLVKRLWPALLHDRQALMERLRLFPQQQLTVVLAPTLAAFRHALPAGADPGALGMYVPSEHTIFLRAPRTEPGGQWDVRGVLRHELAHGLIDLAIDQPVPIWLHEGLAVLMSDELSFLDESELTLRAVAGRLIPLATLVYRFPRAAVPRTLAYSEAASFVRFLLGRDGMHGLQQLLGALARGDTVDGAFREAYGASLHALEQDWSQGLASRFSWATLVTTTAVLGGLGVPLLLAGALRRRWQRYRKYREWEREEARVAGAPTGGAAMGLPAAGSPTGSPEGSTAQAEEGPEPPAPPPRMRRVHRRRPPLWRPPREPT